MIAVNSVGSSPPSDSLTLQTEGEAPGGPPQNVRATATSPRQVTISWNPPKKTSWHGQIQGYHVGYRKQG